MAGRYYTIVTDSGTRKMLEAVNEEKKVNIAEIAVGDGGGGFYTPTPDQKVLKNEIWRGAVKACYINEESENLLIAESIIPSDVGGFTIREMGLFDTEGILIAVCNTPDTQKVRVSDGVVHELDLSMEIALSNADSIQLIVDPNVVTASKQDIENLRLEIKAQLDILSVAGLLEFDPAKEYKAGDYCLYDRVKYKALEDLAPGEWNTEKWEAVNSVYEQLEAIRSETNEQLEGKVDKEEGKGLSANDYTAEDKEKLTTSIKVVVTEDDTTPPEDTTVLWVHG